MFRIGIDLGGTKTAGVVLDEGGKVRAQKRIVTPGENYWDLLNAIAGLVHDLEQEAGERCTVGVGTPGARSLVTGLLKNSNSVCLNGQALDRDLAVILSRPIRIANDADCFALSEAINGAAAGATTAFGVIIGTGTGAGIVVRGRLLQGPNAIAGEWGHNSLPWTRVYERPGPRCYCGKRGCIETFLSGPGLTRDHEKTTGDRYTAFEIARYAVEGDSACKATLARYEDRMARALASVINLLDPDIIVLGGGLSNMERLYQNVPRLLAKYVFSDRVDTPVVPARHGDASGVYGAAWLWPGRDDSR